MQGNLCVERMCSLAMVSRAGFYRSFQQREPSAEEMELRAAIQTIALEHKLRYGNRRLTAELRHRGFLVNHKRSGPTDWVLIISWHCGGQRLSAQPIQTMSSKSM